MRPQHNRLPAEAPRGFSGSAIDRGRPLRFSLDGRLVSGFAGDTVLSAALASGIDTLGLHQNFAIGLTPGTAPAIRHAGGHRDGLTALPMARTPALDGAEFATLGRRRINPIARLFLPGRSLGLLLDTPHPLARPWRSAAGNAADETELVVIGGGVAGMSAALAAARAGLSVTLLEMSPHLGGHSGLFGTQDGEDAPELAMALLRKTVQANSAISVLTMAHAYALRPGLVRLHRVAVVDGHARGEVIDLKARFVVIAAGARERLPIFAGNRLPGIIGAQDAYELAARYGVWPGQSAVFATSSSLAYRLAMLASDVGIAIPRILDTRSGPASRFIEFSRAYGMVQMPGTHAVTAQTSRAGGALSITTDREDADPIAADRLVTCGGWQPDLTLWHGAGGMSGWRDDRHRLEPVGELDGIALAGSAAGYLTRRACIQSGADAIDMLLSRKRKPVEDPVIAPLYETPDAPPAIATPIEDAAPAFLDTGAELLQRPAAARRHWTRLLSGGTHQGGLTALSEAPQPLTITEVAAGVELGLIPPAAAGIVAQERVALIALGPTVAEQQPNADTAPIPAEVPPYLMGRFGSNAHVVRVIPGEPRRLDPGMLIYAGPDARQPSDAIGVVLRPHGEAATALVRADAAQMGRAVSLRDQSRTIVASIALGGLDAL